MSKLVLVEDDEFGRDMLSRRLERQGFEMSYCTVEARTGIG